MLDPKEFLDTRPDYEHESTDGLLQDYRTQIIQSIIQDLSIQRNVSPEVLEYLKSKL